MKNLLRRFKKRLSLTFSILFIESIAELLFPLFIGLAINDLLNDSYTGLMQLAFLGFFTICIGALRRFIDSRAYGYMYEVVGSELIQKSTHVSASKKSAQLGLLNEIVEFLENSLPELCTYVIGLFGTLFILFQLDYKVAIACIAAAAVTLCVYAVTTKKTIRLNAQLNDEFEKRVDVVMQDNGANVSGHLRRYMNLNIRLSDLETINYSLAWLSAIVLLLYAVVASTKATLEYGSIFAVVMYVYQFIESYTESPQYYQQWLRLKEITGRINIQ